MRDKRRNAEKRARSYATLVAIFERALAELKLTSAERAELQRHCALVQRSLDEARSDVQEYGSRHYCAKRYIMQRERLGRYNHDVWYTTETDVDGWYWWGVRESEDINDAPLPISVVRNLQEGKRRKRKDAKAIAEQKALELRKRAGKRQ